MGWAIFDSLKGYIDGYNMNKWKDIVEDMVYIDNQELKSRIII